MDRRAFIIGGGALAGTTALLNSAAAFAQEQATPAAAAEAPQPFSFDLLTAAMKEKAGKEYEPVNETLPEVVTELTYDQHRAIRFRPDAAIWAGEAPFELQAFHPGWLFKQPVHLHVVENGAASRLHIGAEMFEYRKPLDPQTFQGMDFAGVAGFRLHYPLNTPDVMDELVSFLGASYFRALGRGSVYGISARGLAVNTATSAGEEFPIFTDFWIHKPDRREKSITVYAALDSASVTGAYAFKVTPGATTAMEVTARLFIRKDIQRLGIAPMTSMFLFSENNHHAFDDYRGEVHDSEGLKIVRASGEELWRNLNNPKELANSFFGETSLKAFGLFQRDRDFDHYQDAEANYQRRPSLLVEPLGDWGKGHINLVEIPTELEVNDNIVAFWMPEGDVKAGQELEYRYRLTWGSIEEATGQLARVSALRTGIGGTSGVENPEDLRKFVIDFEGEVLGNLSADSHVEASISVTRAEIVHSAVSRIEANGAWRLVVDLIPEGDAPVEMSGFLSLDGQRLSETWAYQWRRSDDQR
ncbi:glucan biosynthesis protein [Chelativorans sp. AA-79]|uniref:glucan biosynthesis protein n=1 Tax=Chelativorans sp. AA-79 TaxID=3028735 RepID=UPI0023F75D80|nr:glucan biosynthesis protein [Chelativorans sp. AA-79]WEX10090.1 glucan biosynthesis protein [Chelativorans sp. AA-79]